LSSGGLGGQSHEHGAQTDNVTALRVVTGSGELLSCSPTERADLFHAVLAGLGQCAVIVEATLRLVAAPVNVRRFLLPYGDLRTFLEDQRVLAADHRFSYLEGQAVPASGAMPARYLLEAAAYGPPAGPVPDDAVLLRGLRFDDRGPAGRPEISDLGYLDFLDRLTPGLTELKALGLWTQPHPWLNLLLPGRHAADLAAPLLDALTTDVLGPGGLILLYPLLGERLGTPLLRMPDDPVPYLLAVLRTVPDDAGVVARVLADNLEVARALRTAGGLVYPVGAVPFTAADWRAQYGDAWPEFEAARHRYDPEGLLAPGQGVFS
jgi:FAD/FMN-containing dehydrogenase